MYNNKTLSLLLQNIDQCFDLCGKYEIFIDHHNYICLDLQYHFNIDHNQFSTSCFINLNDMSMLWQDHTMPGNL